MAPLETCGSECGEGGQWTLLGSTIDPTTTYTRYTPALYTSCTSVAQPTPPSPDTTTFYTRYTTVVQPTPDMPTLCTIYTRQAKFLPQNPTRKKTIFTTYVDLGRLNTPTSLCTRYVNIHHINTSLHLQTIYTVTFQAGHVRSFQRSEFLTRQQTN